MARFHFRLESVRKLRENQEKEALKMLSEAQRNLQDKIDYRDHLLNLEKKAGASRNGLSSGLSSSSAYTVHDQFAEGSRVRLLQAENEIRRAQRSLEKMAIHYMGTRKKKKMIEEIRNKNLEAFKKQERKKEQKQIDELTVMRWRLGKEGV
jgi:flagellar FliJ protein